jgi:hypothetical protein
VVDGNLWCWGCWAEERTCDTGLVPLRAAGAEGGVGGRGDSSSKTDGSAGGGPCRAHRRDSYFERINDSTLLLKTLTVVFTPLVIELTGQGARVQP